MRRWRPTRATKEQILEFIKNRRIIFSYELIHHFGYTHGSACYRLWLLKKQGLALSDGRGAWVLTEVELGYQF
jgi:hypothetical protein